MSPGGTTINLFDYWLVDKDTPDNAGAGMTGTGGINEGHIFRFTDGQNDDGLGGENNINKWTGRAGATIDGVKYESKAGPNYGLVERKLVDGYPKLWEYDSKNLHPYTIIHKEGDESATKEAEWGRVFTGNAQSLSYLFDSSEQTGKEGHYGVKGLLQLQNGYYVYNSKKNFASYNEESNSFDVYNAAGVTGTGTGTGNNGMFFPFDSGSEVFNAADDGTLASNGTNQYAANLNHYFGLTMRTRFMQPANGQVTDDNGDPQDMTYHFSGDDDVWVYIDDVLVGDVGGIHDENTLDINFRTGKVVVGEGKSYEQKTTLKELFQKALGDDFDKSRFSDDTFTNGTIHTLNFFYLERGNSASNLSLMFNLMEVPASSIIKVDQDGNAVEGAGFELYRANDAYEAQGNALASGTTDASGNLALVDGEGKIISFDDLYTADKTTHYLLEEVKVPAGYRSAVADQGGMKLLYTPVPKNGGVLTDAGSTTAEGYIWQNGSHVMPGVTVTAPDAEKIEFYDRSIGRLTDDSFKAGSLFAVLVKKGSGDTIHDVENWHPMWGDALSGYTVSEEAGKQAAIDSLQHEAHVFEQGSNGLYSITGSELPGDIFTYYWMLEQLDKNTDDAEYAIAIYFTSGSIDKATADNTWLVDAGEGFTRQFFARVYVANIQNKLFVQKVDDAGSPLADATFSLYEADQTEVKDGERVLKDGAKAYDTVTTRASMAQPNIEGGAAFPASRNRPLVEGATYYLKETSAPDGYEVNETLVPVVVDADGAHAYAGDEGVDDGVSVSDSVGTLVRTMVQYGTDDSQDSTLHNVLAAGVTGSKVDKGSGNLGIAWGKLTDSDFATKDAGGNDTSADNANLLRLAYGNVAGSDKPYAYGPSSQGGNKQSAVRFESGWGMVRVRQDEEFGKVVAQRNGASFTELGSRDLTALFSGMPTVIVADRPLARLEVKKVVKADSLAGAKTDDEFTFNVHITVRSGSVPVGGYPYRVFNNKGEQVSSNYTGAGNAGSVDFEVKLKSGQYFRVYGLATGDAYTVSEPGSGMPAGYVLAGVNDGDGGVVEYMASEGDPAAVVNKVSGDVQALGEGGNVPTANKLTYTNTIVGLRVLKLNADGEKDASGSYPALAGAEFSIYTDATGADGAPQLGKKVSVTGFTTSGTTDHDGYLVMHGLPAGTYWLVEDKAPGGFAVMEPVRFKVETIARSDAEGGPYAKLTRVNADGSDGAEIPQKPVASDGGANASDTIATITVENRGMTELPQTGSSARPLLYIAAFLVLGAAGFALARAWEGGRR